MTEHTLRFLDVKKHTKTTVNVMIFLLIKYYLYRTVKQNLTYIVITDLQYPQQHRILHIIPSASFVTKQTAYAESWIQSGRSLPVAHADKQRSERAEIQIVNMKFSSIRKDH